jgi:hypothetical protein
MASINNLTVISLYGWMAVRFEVTDLESWYNYSLFFQETFPKDNKSVAKLMIFTSWVWSFVLALPPLLGFGAFGVKDNGMGCAPTWKDPNDFDYNIAIFGVGFFLPLFIIIITNTDLYYLIHKVGIIFPFEKHLMFALISTSNKMMTSS